MMQIRIHGGAAGGSFPHGKEDAVLNQPAWAC